MFKRNTKTTLAGVVAALAALFAAIHAQIDTNPETVANWPETVAIMAAALGLAFARDFNITSEGTKTHKPDEK